MNRRELVTTAEDGFTLIEMLIVCMILPIVIGALGLSLTALLSLQHGTVMSISDTADAQTVSANFEQDVQSAVNLTTSASPSNSGPSTTNPMTQCGSGTQLLGLEWGLDQGTQQYQTVVSYVEVASGSTYSLVRQYCTGASSTPTSSTYISTDIPSSQSVPTITTTSSYTGIPSTAWASAVGVTGVDFSTTEPGSKYSFSLFAVPRESTSSSQLSSVITPTTTCGFATPGTGSYAATLCFANFSSYNYSQYTVSPNPAHSPLSPAPSNCQQMTEGIANTPFTLSFCLSTSSSVGAVVPWVIPTYPTAICTPTSTSEAFLGNNGFYTGIPGDPALYEDCLPSSPYYANGALAYIYISNIQLLDQNGRPATNWELVTGDAETTDTGEYTIWTANEDLNLLPNSPTSLYGNACYDSNDPNDDGLTGVGTPTVECASSVTTNKTGTVMLEAPAPTSLTVTMKGAGLQAIFLGVLLPW